MSESIQTSTDVGQVPSRRVPPLVRRCGTHHHACDCRERAFLEVLAVAQITTDYFRAVACTRWFSDDLPMTTNSISEAIARGLYGRSDKPNAKENQSAEWQAGYKHGLTAQDGVESIDAEFERQGCIMSDGFQEWKKGMWAAIMQRSELAAENDQSLATAGAGLSKP